MCFDGSSLVEFVKVTGSRINATATFCRNHNFSIGICSSVAAEDPEFEHFLDTLPFEVIRFKSGITPIPVTNCYKSPLTLGTDRLAAVVNASYRSPGNDILVIDIGTCITYDFIDAERRYIGGNISPGVLMRLKALNHFTGRLPLVDADGELPEMGYDTETAIRSGVTQSIKYEIDGYITTMRREYPSLVVYITGGGCLKHHYTESNFIFTEDHMVAEGLNIILQYNKQIRTKDIR